MKCPSCGHEPVRTLTSVEADRLTVRTHACPDCRTKFTTHQAIVAVQGCLSLDSQPPVKRPALDRQVTGCASDLIPSGSSLLPEDPEPSKSDPEKRVRDESAGRRESLHAALLRRFCSLWAGCYGAPYKPAPKDKSQLGRLMRTLTVEEACELPMVWRAYLGDHSRFVAGEQRHSLAYFCTSGGWNKYRVRARSAGMSDKEVRGAEGAAAFLALGKEPNGRR
jgi:hypothetical protein